MSADHAILLALIQGLTEFLPISSSAHLILVPAILGWEDQGIAFDVVVHLGTLTAVCTYFHQDLRQIIGDMLSGIRGHAGPHAPLGWWIIIGTVPVGVAGLVGHDWITTVARNPTLIAATSILFGLLLWWADRRFPQVREADQTGWRGALCIGLAQATALIPGVSRSGVTMTAGRLLGLTRPAAARFSFLLGIPVIVLSGGFETLNWFRNGSGHVGSLPLALGFVVSAVSAYVCIRFLMHFLTRYPMDVFVAYRVGLGLVILVMFT